VTQLNIYVEGEGAPYVLYPQSYAEIRITNTYRRQMQKIEVVDAEGKVEKDIDCSGVPREFDEVIFHADWSPEVFIGKNESFEYEPKKKKWMKKISV